MKFMIGASSKTSDGSIMEAFQCRNCGAVFLATKDDYKVEDQIEYYTGGPPVKTFLLFSKCPSCGFGTSKEYSEELL